MIEVLPLNSMGEVMPDADLPALLFASLKTGGFSMRARDDFSHFGLRISPDIDTLLYTLSGKASQAQSWGREGESRSFTVKGPTAKLMAEPGVPVDNAAIAAHYAGLIDGLLIHTGDPVPEEGLAIGRTDTRMQSIEDRARVAAAVPALVDTVRTA